jgi:UDP-hydrolysing UDP-N-acetyl-D-glucosamine 2-epimerase
LGNRIALITTTRAEWHLLQPLVRELGTAGLCEPLVLAGGAHLMAEHGMTIDAVEAGAGCPVERVRFAAATSDQDDYLAMTHNMSRALSAFADALERQAPDVVVVLGDRFEIMAAALGAVSLRLPLAHIEGGHVTEGAIDDRFRHAITKLADLHYVALPIHRRRLEALGEDPARIIVTGPLGATLAGTVAPLTRTETLALTGFDPEVAPIIIATFHPETATDTLPRDIVATIRRVVGLTATTQGPVPRFLFTAANLDPGGAEINAGVQSLAAEWPDRVKFVPTIGRDYWRALRTVAGVLGNSSSGILESSALGVPTINVGVRQAGRDRYGMVVELPWDAQQIADAVTRMTARWHNGHHASSGSPVADKSLPWRIIADHLGAVVPGALRVKPTLAVRD